MLEANATTSPLAQFFPCNPTEWTSKTGFPALFMTLATVIFLSMRGKSKVDSDDSVHDLGGISLLTAWPFFTKRFDFIMGNFRKTRGKSFQFRVLKNRVIAMPNSEDLRRAFYTDPNLSLTDGYRLLTGGFPFQRGTSTALPPKRSSGEDKAEFFKFFNLMFGKERLAELIPVILEDAHCLTQKLGNAGTISPFVAVYDLIFQITVRLAACREIADDPVALGKLKKHFLNLENSATPTSLLLPWLPSPSRISNVISMVGLGTITLKFINERRNAAVLRTDAIDFLINHGKADTEVVQVVLGLITAGVVNTAVTTCWILTHLAAHPYWMKKAVDECKAMLAKHTEHLSSEPLHKRLASIPLSAWEEELPAMDLIVKETIRLNMVTATLRRNVADETILGDGIKLNRGDFVFHSTASVHLNPEIYPNPNKFDPSRFSEERQEDKKETYAYVGWGVGRHPCPGQRVGKLEMNLVLSLLLLEYEYELVDASGRFPKVYPQSDRNDTHEARPAGEPCFLKYRRVFESSGLTSV